MNDHSIIKNKTHWIALLPLSIFLFFDFIQLNIMSTLSPVILKTMPISSYELGFISSLFFYVNLVLLFPAGFLLDKYNVKWLVILSIIITVIGILIFAFSPSIHTAIIWRLLSGFAGAFSYISCVKLLATHFPRKFLGLLLGLTGIVIMSSGVVVQYPLLKILNLVGLSKTLYLDAILGMATIVLLSIFINEKPNPVILRKKNLLVLKKPVNWLIAAYACLTNFPLFVLGALWGNLYLINTQHFSLTASSIITSMIFIGNMIGAPTLGKISDNKNERKQLMILSAILMLIVTAIIMTLPPHQSVSLFITLFFILGFSTGSQTLAYALIVDVNSRNNTSTATSMLSFLSVGGGAIAQPLFGFFIHNTGKIHYQNGMYIMLFASVLALLFSVILIKMNRNYNELLMFSL